ncbi:MAG: hypothetical protein Q9195_001743 [Heterodermia aff. obscurata]
MSSMRNAVQRRNHKERAQPREREKWGVLEKHKDYSLRAADYNAKKARLKILRQKAAERNPDEFHFGMYSSMTHDRGQKLADRGNKTLSQDAVKLLKTQDAGYLKTLGQQTKKAREKLERAFVLTEGKGVVVRGQVSREGRAERIVFVDNHEEQGQWSPARLKSQDIPFNESDGLADLEEMEEKDKAKKLLNGPPKSQRVIEAENEALRSARILRKKRKRDEETQSSRLKALKSREKDLLIAERELDLQRAKMSGSVGGINKAGVKWRIRERKR